MTKKQHIHSQPVDLETIQKSMQKDSETMQKTIQKDPVSHNTTGGSASELTHGDAIIAEFADSLAMGDKEHGLIGIGGEKTVVEFTLGGFVE